jgi:hypothetical protein
MIRLLPGRGAGVNDMFFLESGGFLPLIIVLKIATLGPTRKGIDWCM